MKIIATFKDPLSHPIGEAVNIVFGKEDILMNSKAEFRQGAVGESQTKKRIGKLKFDADVPLTFDQQL